MSDSDVASRGGERTSFIDGRPVRSVSDAVYDLVNPANGRSQGTGPIGDAADADCAVASARAAFEDGRWRNLGLSARRAILLNWAELIERDADYLTRLDAVDMGKPVGLPAFTAADAAALIRNDAYGAERICGESYVSDSNCLVMQQRVPRGVVVAVTPWNFPTFNAAMKLGPALAAGNCVVLKPSESSPSSALHLAHLADEAGVPPGVLNVVLGSGDIVGKALALHNEVDMITFTGSTVTGGLMLQYAGMSNLKFVHTECGGKSPHIVFGDFDNLDTVADHVANGILVNQGQVCSAGTRLLVQKDVEDLLVEKIIGRIDAITAGDPLDPSTTYGPLVSEAQMKKVLTFMARGKEEGGELVAGGRRILEESGGFYVAPTIFRNVSAHATIACEEIFGPVLSVITFEDIDQAIEIANSTIFGLIAHCWTCNTTTGMRAARDVRAGMVIVNASSPEGDVSGALSIEPYGQSGTGVELGTGGLEAYFRRQNVWINHG